MKKKVLSFFVAFNFVVSAAAFPVSADNGASDVEIRFNLGSSELSINSKKVSVPAPFSAGQGTTMVPLRVISEAFGATVDWNANEKKITIKYDDSEIVMYINSKTAVLNGNETLMAEAPVIKDGVTMVPLRFISENFGAVVGYDQNTKEVTVNKENKGSKQDSSAGIDIANLLNVSDKAYIGDSYFKWSMKKSPSFSLKERNFDGSEVIFADESEMNEIYVYISSDYPEDFSIEKAMVKSKEYFKDETLISQKQEKRDNADYFEISTKSKKYTTYYKGYWKDKKLYEFIAYVDNKSEKKDADLTKEVFETIKLSYGVSDDIENLANVSESGSRKFEQNNLKISLNLPTDWEQVRNDDKINYFEFRQLKNYKEDEVSSRIIVQMFSREDGQTLDAWADKDAKALTKEYNPNNYKQTKISKKIGTYESKGYKEELKLSDDAVYSSETYYIFGGKYKYQIDVICDSKVYNNSAQFAEIEKIANSFRFEEPDASEVGILSEGSDDDEKSDKITEEVKLKDIGISLQMPVSWKKGSDGYQNSSGTVSFYISDYKQQVNITTDLLKALYSYSDDYTSLETVTNKYKMGNRNAGYAKGINKTTGFYIEDFVCSTANGHTVILTVITDVAYYGERNKNIIKDILSSVKFL